MMHGSSGSSILRCSITVAAKGADADMGPLVRRYDISDGADKDMMDSAIERTRQTLGQGRRININDVMLLYAGCAYAVASGSRDGGDGISDGIKSGLPALLADDQVLIGIREMTNHVSISVTDTSSGRTTRSTVVDPLRPDPRQARLQQQQQQQQQQQLERRSPK